MIEFNVSDDDMAITPLDAAKNQLMQFRSAVNMMQREATELIIADSVTEAKAGEMTAQVKSLKKQIEAQQDMLIAEPKRFVLSVQNFTLPFRKDLDAIEGQLKRKLGDYGYKVEMERRKAEAAAQAAAAALQKKIDKEAKKAGIEPVQLPAPVVPQERQPLRTESGTTSYQTDWDYEVVDIDAVPNQYVQKAIKAASVRDAIRAGIREIAGLKIFETVKIQTRTRG